MRIHHAFSLALATGFLLASPLANAKNSDPAGQLNPQIVHISYLDGDVRVSRGTEGGAPKNVDWEKAVSGLPLETGFSLATGEGRAVIEFEDASTVYLAPNSVLIFNALATIGDVPHTEVALLTGTATLEVEPTVAGDVFILRTPTDTISVPYGKKIDLRVTSYMDAIAITPIHGGFIQVTSKTPLVAAPARTLYFSSGKPVAYTAPASAFDVKDWDQWVTARVDHRDAAMAAVLKQTGLKKPVPGLTQLDGRGKFVECPGYGTCWEPPMPAAPAQTAANGQPGVLPANSVAGSDAHPIVFSATDSTSPSVAYSGSQAQRSGGGSPLMLDYANYGMFPCGPGSAYFRYAMLSGMGYMGYMSAYNALPGSYWYASDPWAWAVCHSGSWLYQNNRYLWVPGNNIQRNIPVRWLRVGHSVGFVPLHPHDVNGQLPINRDHGIIPVGGKSLLPIQRGRTGSGEMQPRLLKSAPKEIGKPLSPSLTPIGAPHMEAHVLRADRISDGHGSPGNPGSHEPGNGVARPGSHRGNPGGEGPRNTSVSIPITFDHRSQSFMMSHQIDRGSSFRTVSEPVGDYLARSSGTYFGGNQGGRDGGDGYSGRGSFNGGNGVGLGNRGGLNGGGGFNNGGGNPGFNPGSSGSGLSGGGSMPTGGGGFHGGGGSVGGGNMGGGGSMGGGGGHAPGGGGPVATPNPH